MTNNTKHLGLLISSVARTGGIEDFADSLQVPGMVFSTLSAALSAGYIKRSQNRLELTEEGHLYLLRFAADSADRGCERWIAIDPKDLLAVPNSVGVYVPGRKWFEG